MERHGHDRIPSVGTQALWNLRWPALYLLGPLLGVLLINLWFGLPGRLWPLAAAFFLLGVVLFAVLLRGEIRRLRGLTRQRDR